MAAQRGGGHLVASAPAQINQATQMPAKHRRPPPRSRTTSTGRRLYVASDYLEPLNKEDHMQAVGVAASVVVGLIVLAGVVIGVRSLPDLNRYRRMRQM
jgi:hypothetical protein